VAVTDRAAAVVKGRRYVPIGERGRFAVVGRDRLITHTRACVAGSLRCGSARRLRVSTPEQAGLRMSAGESAGCRVPSAGIKIRRCAGVLCSTCWGNRRRCRVAPASSGFDYPGDKAKAGARVRNVEGVCTLRPVDTVSCAGLRVFGTGLPRVIVIAHRLRPHGIVRIWALHLEVGNREVMDPMSVGRGVGGSGPAGGEVPGGCGGAPRRPRRRATAERRKGGKGGKTQGRQGRQGARAARSARSKTRATSPAVRLKGGNSGKNGSVGGAPGGKARGRQGHQGQKHGQGRHRPAARAALAGGAGRSP